MAEDKLIVALSADIKDLKAKLSEAQNVLKDYANDTENTTGKTSKGFTSIASSVKNLIGAYLGLQAAQMALSTAFDNSLKMDALQGSFSAIFGSAEAGERQLERLRAKSEELGVEFSSLAGAYKLFAGATTQSGMSIAETNKIFDSVAKTSAVLKLSAEDTEGALRALAQMMGKGTVQAEELRGQLGERVPGAFKLAANAMGVTEQELGKMLESGQVMARDLLPKLATELDKAFGNKVKGEISGLTAEWNRFKNAIFGSTSGFSNFFATILGGVNTFLEKLKEMGAYMADPRQFQADKAFGNLKNAIDKASNTQELNNLIITFRKIQSGLQEGTPMWRAYTDAIIEAGNKIKDFNGIKVQPKKAPVSLINFQMPSMQEQLLTADIDLSSLEDAKKEISDFQAQTNMLNGSLKELAVIGGIAFTPMQIGLAKTSEEINSINALQQKLTDLTEQFNSVEIGSEQWVLLREQIGLTEQQIASLNLGTSAFQTNMQNVVDLVGGALTQSFESALTSGQDFFKVLGQAIKALIARLLAAVAAAAALNILLAVITGGASIGTAAGSFAGILKSLSGFNFGGSAVAGGASQRVVSPVGAGALGQGSVEFSIMGDKLYGVLKNYESRLDRLQ